MKEKFIETIERKFFEWVFFTFYYNCMNIIVDGSLPCYQGKWEKCFQKAEWSAR